jgi:ATP-dependent Lhr-like helicase
VQPSAAALSVADCIRRHGASFFDEIMDDTGLLKTQVQEALAELVGLGLVNSDSFGGLRALLAPSAEGNSRAAARRLKAKAAIDAAGRWSLARHANSKAADAQAKAAAIEHVARTLLKRYGMVFWRVLARDAPWLPPWRDLLRVYRKLEGRGEIRGGRFVSGFSGEQFALPDAVGTLREVRRQPLSETWTSVSGSDPLNLIGIVTLGPRLAALSGNRLLYRDGLPIATLAAGKVEFFETLDAKTEWEARKALLQSPSNKQSQGPGLRIRGEDRLRKRRQAAATRLPESRPAPAAGRN